MMKELSWPRLLPLLLVAGAAGAEVKVLDAVVSTGSRVEAAAFDQPYAIDAVQLGEGAPLGPGVHVSEVLGAVPGVVVQNRQNLAQDLQISIRGFGARAAFGVRGVKLITDGIPASTPDGQGQAATFNLDVAERIEVLRGPFATIYGNHAGGVIQLFSRDGEGRPRLRGSAFVGPYGSWKSGVGAEGEHRGIGFVLDASRFQTHGERRHSAARRDQAFAKLSLRPDDDSRLRLLFSSLDQPDTEDPLGLSWETYRRDRRAVEAVALQYRTRKSIRHRQGGAVYERRWGEDQLQLQLHGGTRRVIQYQSIPRAVQAQPRHAGGVVSFDRRFEGAGLRWTTVRQAGTGKLSLTSGVDYDRSRDDRQGHENFIGEQLGVKGRLRRDEINTVSSSDPYVQLLWQQGDWDFSAGLRHSRVRFKVDDRYVTADNGDDSGAVRYRKTTPALGLLWRAHPLLNVYGSFGSGFETPTFGELAYTAAGGFNLGLRPATSRQFELGLKAFVSDETRLNVALFEVRSKDEIVVAAALGGRSFYHNAGRTLRRGLELAVDSRLSAEFELRAALTLMKAEYDQAFAGVSKGKRIPGVPRLAFWSELRWQPRPELSAALEFVHRGRLEVNDRNDARAAPACSLLNARLGFERQWAAWTLESLLRVDNVLDRKHVAAVIVGDGNGRFYEPGPGRSVYAGVELGYRF